MFEKGIACLVILIGVANPPTVKAADICLFHRPGSAADGATGLKSRS
jgi:hypothetical protein